MIQSSSSTTISARDRWIAVTLLLATASAGSATEGTPSTSKRPDLVLITLDTTRDDFVGPAPDGGASRTPNLDRLAARGTRFRRALAPSPLTLPSHASLLTGLAPPEHGLRDNSAKALAGELPTLATVLSDRGYRTAAFVATRVLDRRFGLARGFDHYDDRMPAEKLGEYGFPERDAAAVTDAALGWLTDHREQRPLFLWVHYYDPHAPYQAPGSAGNRPLRTRYGDEIAFVDQQIGRLLAKLPEPRGGRLVAVVGDHGEALGEHGERTHGVFLYRASLEVPLIFAGPRVPRRKTVTEAVGTRRLAATVLALLFPKVPATLPGTVLPGLGLAVTDPAPSPVFSEALMPQTTYGWSPLTALSTSRHRLIVAPRPELYDLDADPAEANNLIRSQPALARQLRNLLTEMEASFELHDAKPMAADGRLAADLRSLGYLAGGSGRSGLDPKDGIALLAELADAKALLAAGRTSEGLERLETLNKKSPANVPFLLRLGSAQLSAGRHEEAIETYGRARDLNPNLEFVHHHLGRAYLAAGRLPEAQAAFEASLTVDPRFAEAWLSLAQLSHRQGGVEAEKAVLDRAIAAPADSVAILVRRSQIAIAENDPRARALLTRATDLMPELPLPWLMLGRWHLERSETEPAREFLNRAVGAAPASPVATEARSLLAEIR